MLRTRVITALVLLALLLGVLYSGSFVAFAVVAALFLGAALWEAFRLFAAPYPRAIAVVWTIAYGVVLVNRELFAIPVLLATCALLWAVWFVPLLAVGLPPLQNFQNRLLNAAYAIAVFGCFIAIAALFSRSAVYLVSVMALVWIADIGAYFAGKAFGRRKLAPSISPGKSWEGAIGGWLAVLVLFGAAAAYLELETFGGRLLARGGWFGFVAVMTVLVAASVIGDLFESQLKRRAQIKDSSNLLPGHGGVLDRIDALIPTLPLAVLIDIWL